MKLEWKTIDWDKCFHIVSKLQYKITVAAKNNEWKKVTQLQRIVASSFRARALAVKQVSISLGRSTPGVDKIVWDTDERKINSVYTLQKQEYIASPVKRVQIPKDNGKRLLGIPTIFDRAIQALHLLTLDPVAEAKADPNSFRFRKIRSAQDAFRRRYWSIGGLYGATQILDRDIKQFFDKASHDWILKNIPMKKSVLEQFLKAGFIFIEKMEPTEIGVPQGRAISPTISNIVLDGLELSVELALKQKVINRTPVRVIRYADDFLVTARHQWVLHLVLPRVEKFLLERGLQLNYDKTRFVNLKEEVLYFLGYKFEIVESKSKNYQVLIARPSETNIQSLKKKLCNIYSKKQTKKSSFDVVRESNSLIIGWSNYFRVANSTNIFSTLSKYLWNLQLNWAQIKFPTIGKRRVLIKCFVKKKATFKFIGVRYLKNQIVKTVTRKTFTDFKIQYIKSRIYHNPYLLNIKKSC
jgi:RNA-directed DNA polymerase